MNAKLPSRKKQQGLSLLGWVCVLVVVASTVTLALRLGPHYLEFHTIQATFDGLPVSQVHNATKGEIREMLRKRFRVNSIRDIEIKDALTIERKKESTLLSFEYEVREPLIYNVDAVLSFSEQREYK